MRSNTGVIGAQRLNTTSIASGVHGLADLYNNVKGATWPAGTATASVVPSVSSVNEGGTVAFAITAYAPAGQTTLYWSMRATTGTSTAADFGDSSISGSVVMTAGYAGILTGTVSRTWAADLFTEGTEVFVLDVSLTNGGAAIGTSTAVTVADTSLAPVATVTGTPSSLNEGSAATYTITIVSGLAAGATVYWVMRTTTGTALAADFTDTTLSGSYTVSAGLVDTVTRTWANDVTTEGSEIWVMDVRIGSITGTLIGTSSPATTVADTSVAAELYAFTSFTFTPGVALGYLGPTLANLLNSSPSYSTTTYPWLSNTTYFNVVTQGIQQWQVPATGTYRLTARGATGGIHSGSYQPGFPGAGATAQADIALSLGTVLYIVVGQKPTSTTSGYSNGSPGGGGTFVYTGASASAGIGGAGLMLVAGGGGGTGHGNSATTAGNGVGGSATTNSAEGVANVSFGINAKTGTGSAGNKGIGQGGNKTLLNTGYGGSGGGAGWLSDGDTFSSSSGGLRFQGGGSTDGSTMYGGWGGGGGSDGSGNAGGGSGGYTGGGAGQGWTGMSWGGGGGGGSYAVAGATNVIMTAGSSGISYVNVASGYVTITKL